MEAVEKHRDTTGADDYHPPQLKCILPYLPAGDETTNITLAWNTAVVEDEHDLDPQLHARNMRAILRAKNRNKRRSLSSIRAMMEASGGKTCLYD